jgi:ketosteroid isomerase-like protein
MSLFHFLPLALAGAVQPPSAQATEPLDTIMDTGATEISAALDEVYRRFAQAYRDLDAAAIDDIYIDGCIYIPGAATRGITPCAEAMEGFAQMFEAARAQERTLAIEFRVPNRRIYSDVIVDGGYYRLSASDRDEPIYGKFVIVAEQGADGGIRFIVDGFSPAPAEAFERLRTVPILAAEEG